MHLSVFVFIYLLSVFGLCSAFFLWKDKGQPIFLCLKICPLYCPKNRRQDDDSSLVFFDNFAANMKTLGNGDDILPPGFPVRCNPTISSASQLKSNDSKPFSAHLKYDEDSSTYYQDYDTSFPSEDIIPSQHHTQPSGSSVDCKWESSKTSEESTTIKNNRRYDDDTSSHIYVDHDSPYVFAEDTHDYEVFPHPHFYWHHKLKTTAAPKPTTAAPTTTPGYIFYEDAHEYEFFPHPHFYWHHWHHTSTTPKPTTTAAPTTPEPTYICELCKSKCA